QLREDLHAATPGQVDVEQDEPGARRVGVRAGPAQELQGLLARAHHVKPVLDLVILEGLPGHEDVAFVVLHQEYVDYSRVFELSHRLPWGSRRWRCRPWRARPRRARPLSRPAWAAV